MSQHSLGLNDPSGDGCLFFVYFFLLPMILSMTLQCFIRWLWRRKCSCWRSRPIHDAGWAGPVLRVAVLAARVRRQRGPGGRCFGRLSLLSSRKLAENGNSLCVKDSLLSVCKLTYHGNSLCVSQRLASLRIKLTSWKQPLFQSKNLASVLMLVD